MVQIVGLIALAIGYMVFVAGAKEKEGVKLLGQGIGILVMVASVFLVLCFSAKCLMKGQCPLSGGMKSHCSMSEKAQCMLGEK